MEDGLDHCTALTARKKITKKTKKNQQKNKKHNIKFQHSIKDPRMVTKQQRLQEK